MKEVNKQEERIREIAWKAWHGAANAFRLYPDNKHTFTEYWDGANGQFSEFMTSQSSIDTGDRFKNWLEERIESYEEEKKIHGDKERIKARLSMLNETLENYNRWAAIPPIDTGVEDKVNDVVHCASCGYGFLDCECGNWDPVYGLEVNTKDEKESAKEAAGRLNPYTIPQFSSGWKEGFIAGAKWASSGEAVEEAWEDFVDTMAASGFSSQVISHLPMELLQSKFDLTRKTQKP